ncbi:MAG: nucleoside-diphosphate sugar epimerase/dehydratase [Bacillota bacterium]|nr:nucleoside-diphosphate sugar epimerase/dehydratase [Bacillota bacterium]
MESIYLSRRKIILYLLDMLFVVCSFLFVGLVIRSFWSIGHLTSLRIIVLKAAVVYSISFFAFRVYSIVIIYADINDYLRIAFACSVSTILLIAISPAIREVIGDYALLVYLISLCLIILLTTASRIFAHFYFIHNRRALGFHQEEERKKNRVLIIGAGAAGGIIVNNLKQTGKNDYEFIGIIDDDKKKKGKEICGVKVLGTRKKIEQICQQGEVDTILLSIAAISNEDKKDILDICSKTGCKVRVLPHVDDLVMSGDFSDNLRSVEIEDLLARDPIKLDNAGISEYLKDKVVMVTGGAGSIGSELCRQIARFKPKKILILDIWENGLYDIGLEMLNNFPDVECVSIIASIRDHQRLCRIFSNFSPEVVFHAAAHKHVPLMEANPVEAIKNNVFGTLNLVNTSVKYGVSKFVLISTDKAVRPTSIMGTTKRICEMIVQSAWKKTGKQFVAVRFGNVLGSNGSVVPLFKKQILKGGPVTVTHKDITRYFMTISEATQLVLQAGVFAKSGEIFVLDMGEPVKIYDLAVNMIRLSGLEPNVDIPIKITGLRPGEKLYEELLTAEEGLTKTTHQKIYIAKPNLINLNKIEENLALLQSVILSNNTSNIKEVIKQVVPSYSSPNIDEFKFASAEGVFTEIISSPELFRSVKTLDTLVTSNKDGGKVD